MKTILSPIFATLAFAAILAPLHAQEALIDHKRVHATRFNARFKEDQPNAKAAGGYRPNAKSLAVMKAQNLQIRRQHALVPGLATLEFSDPESLPAAAPARTALLRTRLAALRASGEFLYIEPDYMVHADQTTPTDVDFTNGTLWGLRNTGQFVNGQAGVAGVDIGAPAAWDITTGSPNIIVAVIDSGIRFTHQDLAANMWRNPGEIPSNGIDDDGNGYVDDVFGINAIANTGNPMDDQGHGTHVAGTIGAVANDGNPHVGVAWNIRLMACKFISAADEGFDSDAIDCIEYAVANGATILNNSWGGTDFSQATKDAIEAAGTAGALFVAAAGNGGDDDIGDNNDQTPHYPSSYEASNIISVAAIDHTGALASFSNFGHHSVHLGAPGVAISSTDFSTDTAAPFNKSGTSMATPHVSGVAALVKARYPGIGSSALRRVILAGTVPTSSVNGNTMTGGRVNAFQALQKATEMFSNMLTGDENNPGVQNVPDQFNKLKHNPEALGFYRGSTPDPSFERHYQGIVRKNGPGTPYFFLDRNGDDGGDWGEGTLSVIKMGSRDRDGERLRSNRLALNLNVDQTPPPATDVGVALRTFNGQDGLPRYATPGGMQGIGNLLVIPMSKPQGGLVASSTVVVMDVTDPEQPTPILNQNLNPNYAHAAAVVRLDDGRYLLAVLASADATSLDLYLSDGTALRGAGFTFWRSYDPSGVGIPYASYGAYFSGSGVPTYYSIPGWPLGDNGYQMLNFVRDTNGDIFLIGTRRAGNHDMMDLLQVEVEAASGLFSLVYRSQIHQDLNSSYSGTTGDNRAGAGVYISPSGQLVVYTSEHEIDEGVGLNNSVRIGESRSREVHTDPLQDPCGGWVELYEDDDGWVNLPLTTEEGFPGGFFPNIARSIVIDYADRAKQNLPNLDLAQDFGGAADSLIYFLPPGQWFDLFENPSFGGRSHRFLGTGRVEYVPRLADVGDFGDTAHSIMFQVNQQAPVIAFITPDNNAVLTSLPTLEGAVTDDFGTPSVSLTIQETNSPNGVNRWWNGTAWQTTSVEFPAAVTGQIWSVPGAALPTLHSGLSYRLTAKATDHCGSTDSDVITVSVPITALAWDPGATHSGTEILNQSDTLGGAWIFKITAQNSQFGAWRTALNALQGEADVFMSVTSPPITSNATIRSVRVGSDGWVLHSSQFAAAQDWYLVVTATPGAQWNIISGDVFINELGTLATDGSSGSSATIGAEGTIFFRTTVPVDALAWRLWLNGAPNTLYVKRTVVPLPGFYELIQPARMLVVPPYLNDGSHFVSVPGDPGTPIVLDSRQQPIADLPFLSTGNVSVAAGEFPYLTYRVQVPLEQLAWQVNLIPGSGESNLALRREQVPNEFRNDGFSDVPAPTGDSVTFVPAPAGPGAGLSDGTYYVTVYAGGEFTATLTSGNPAIPDEPYNFSVVNDSPNRTGWRYYRVADIEQQLGSLGWELNLTNQSPGTEIALRRNSVPGRWSSRDTDNTFHSPSPIGYADYSSTSGFLQRPGHQADVWYVGIYTPQQALGTFTLDAHPIVPATSGFDGSNTTATGLEPGRWRYHRFDVSAGVLGWDVRLKGVSTGTPYLVVRRDVLPDSLFGTDLSASPTWPSGAGVRGGVDWTTRQYDTGAPTYQPVGPRLVAGMGRPLEPGTYYAGVKNESTTNMAYTVESRGIGTGQSIPVTDFNPAVGSSATITNLVPREAAYFKVTIPPDTPSWEFTLTPTAGEMLMAIRRGTVPDFNATERNDSYGVPSVQDNSGTGGSREEKAQKPGPERFLILPSENQDTIVAGDYYIAVVSEGVNPISNNVIGTGTSSGVLTSLGALETTDLGSASLAGITQPVSLAGGQVKSYRFTVPAGTASLEVRLDNRVGNPWLNLISGSRVPKSGIFGNGHYDTYGNNGGQTTAPPGGVNFLHEDNLVTIANPPAGTYSLTVRADPTGSPGVYDYPAASADLVIVANVPVPLAFDGGTATVSGQVPTAWRYFTVTVPAGVLGWDVRLKDVTGGTPYLRVARDALPGSLFGTSNLSTSPTWPSGAVVFSNVDWTARPYDNGAPTYQPVGPRLVAGMGRPLEPGTYYVGVYNSTANASSYTVESRGIGTGQSIPVTDFNPAVGSSAAITNLAPREAAYFKVTIPPNTPSWEFTLTPTTGEMLMAIRRGTIPDFNATERNDSYGVPSVQDTGGSREEKAQKTGPERFLILPRDNQDSIVEGDYYIAVVSEGVNPPDSSTIGTGASSGVLTSLGELATTDLGTASLTGITQPVSLAGAQVKSYRFTVPAGTASLEVRLDNRVGNPWLSMIGGGRVPKVGVFYQYHYDTYGNNGGQTTAPPGGVNFLHEDNLVTIANPPPGTYSLTVRADQIGSPGVYNYADASADLVIRQVPRILLNYAASLNENGKSHTATRQLIDTQKDFFEVAVPTTLDGQPVLGWLVKLANLQGDTTLKIYKTWGNPGTGITLQGNTALMVPPFLTLGDTWYVEATATGPTHYTITNSPITLERPVWTMPSGHNTTFGDSGNDSAGTPLPGDRSVDLSQDAWHIYAIDVTEGNSGLLRTELQAINGNPNLYIREDGVPTTDHDSNGGSSGGTTMAPRSLTSTASEYGNWVPLDGRYEKQLRAGRWYLGVKATGASNARYRLKVSTGQVTDLALDGGMVASQNLVGRDWRYYRFTVPDDAPNTWSLTFSQQVGDVNMWVRDTVPPGNASDGLETTSNQNPGIRSWYSDNKNQGPYSSTGQDAADTYSFNTPPLRPGHTYYVGFRAANDATFSFSSATSGGSIGTLPELDYYTGTINTSVAAGTSVLYRMPVPPEATRIKWTATHPNTVQTRLEQGTVPGPTGSLHWTSGSSANVAFNQSLTNPNGWPWQPNQDYYLRVTNTSGSAQQVALTMAGKNAVTEDEDNDGLPDQWEIQYFSNSHSYTGPSDPDGDGVTNAVEFADGTNPNNVNSAKYFLAVTPLGGTATKTPNQPKYDRGTVVSLIYTPPGNTFLGWQRVGSYGDDFAVKITGTVTIPADSTYTFGTNAADGSRLKVNNVTVITDDTTHGVTDKFGLIALTAGTYTLELTAFEYNSGEALELFAASGSHASFNSNFKLLGDTANGGLVVQTSSGASTVPGLTVWQVAAVQSGSIYSLANMDALLAGIRAKRTETTLIAQTINYLGSGSGDGHFANIANFPLQQPDPGNPLSLGMFGDYTLAALNSVPLADAVDAPGLTFTTSGEAPWLGELSALASDTVDYAGSGPISHNQSSSLSTTVVGPGTLTFRWKVSSEANGDYLQFLVNGSVNQQISGEQAYALVTCTVAAGTQTLTWRYVKNGSVTTGSDRGWVDQLNYLSNNGLSRPNSPQVDYTFNSGLVPAGAAVYGNAAVAASGGVGNSGVLKLVNAVAGQSGSMVISEYSGGVAQAAFIAAWDVRMGEGTTPPADGMSFNWSPDIPNANSGSEEGAGTGLSICFDIFNNGGNEAPSIDIKWGGAVIATNVVALSSLETGSAFVPVIVQMDANGLVRVFYNNNVGVSATVPGWNAMNGGKFSLVARTGGFNENIWVDNLAIQTIPTGLTYATWKATKFTPAQLADPLISGPNADADHDGLKNFIEFAFGLNPVSGASIQLPQPQLVGGNFVISFTEPLGISGVTYGAGWSPTMLPGSWLPVLDTGSGGIHTFSVPIGNNSKVFMRLTVTNITDVTPLSPIENWRQTNFNTISDTGVAANEADPDHDGLQNLIEFALGLDPNSGASIQLPQPQRIGGNFVISFTEPAGISGVTYSAEWSPTLAPGSWLPVPDTGSGGVHTFSVPIGTHTGMFMRLKVTNP